MRGLTYGTYTEALYTMPVAAGAVANTAARTLASYGGGTQALFKMPGGTFWNPVSGTGQGIRVVARGFYSTTGTAPTLTVQAALDTTAGSFGVLLAGTGAYTTETTITDAAFEFQFDANCEQTGTSGSMAVAGTFTHGGTGGSAAGNNSTAAGSTLMVGGLTNIAFSTAVDQYLEIWVTWGTAATGNTLTLTQLNIFGLN